MNNLLLEPTISHTKCQACLEKRLHADSENRMYHPLVGHGYTKEQGWSHPEAKRLHDLEAKESKSNAKT